jgi:hypothetical protein
MPWAIVSRRAASVKAHPQVMALDARRERGGAGLTWASTAALTAGQLLAMRARTFIDEVGDVRTSGKS